MSDVKDAVKCCGTFYSIEAWKTAYDYIVKNKAPDSRFENRMKRLDVSRSDAYMLYRAIRNTPREVKFVRKQREQREPNLIFRTAEETPELASCKR
jgi:hypothetical protein